MPALFAAVTAAILVAAVTSICVGKYSITVDDILAIFAGKEVDDMTRRVFLTLRLPRTIMAIIAGVGLGVAGSVYQIIFKNPLASPDIIGIAGGANLGAAIAIVSVSTSGMFAIASGAFWGGLAAVVCVMLLVKATRSRSTSTYVLAGIVINAISKAIIMALKYFADPENEHLIQKALHELRKGKTVLMIAHHLTSVQDADKILVIAQGKIAEEGTHSELIARNGIYNSMWNEYQRTVTWTV